MRFRFLVAGISAAASLFISQTANAQKATDPVLQTAEIGVKPLPALDKAVRLRHSDPNQVLNLAISLPYADPEGIQEFVDRVSNPKSPDYRHFLTPEQVGEFFGLPIAKVRQVANYLNSKGFNVTLIGDNHLTILVQGTVAQAEAAFNTTIDEYQSQGVSRLKGTSDSFYAYSKVPTLPVSIAPYVSNVTGLENYTKPQPRALTPTQTRTLYNLAPAYNAGQQGQGRAVAISNFDGFRLNNVPLYYSQFGLPTPSGGVGSNVHVVVAGTGAGGGTPQGEGDLDIQMVLGMAPLCDFTIYDGTDLIAVLTREVNDNTADVISESYGWNLPAATANSAHNLHLSMSAQGITYMAASGDSGTTIEPYSYPNYEPEVLMVGGTIATVNASGVRTSEVGWSGSGGGWSTKSVAFNTRPSWQTGTGVPTNVNFRMAPDVSLNASGNGTGAYQFYFNSALTSGYVGTSFACPVFAGGLAVAEQKIIGLGGLPANGAGKRRFGRIQDLIYAQNGRTDVWTDITSGNNGTLPNGSASNCTAKWDMVTGWGAINWDAFVATQATSSTPPTAPTNLVATAGNAQVGLTWSASGGATSYNVKRATVSGGPYTTVGSTSSTSFTNTGLTNGTTYFYVVTATNSFGESGNSNQASATPTTTTTTQLLLNPGFESGAVNWTATAGVIDNSASQAAHGGSWKAWLNGYGTAHTDSIYQQVTIPAAANSATLTFWLHIDSAETTTTTQFDKLQVQIRNSSNTVLATLATYSNLNKAAGYTQRTFNLNAYKGQTIRVYLLGTEDSSLQTSFVADDFALTVN